MTTVLSQAPTLKIRARRKLAQFGKRAAPPCGA
jgi:hypothetical protein